MDDHAMAAMEANRVAKAELHEYLQKVNGPNGGRGHSTAAYRAEGDLHQARPQLQAPEWREEDATTKQLGPSIE
jgi:hypothetical protein